jgi:hypothetical protein
MANFEDKETSSGNIFTAGTWDTGSDCGNPEDNNNQTDGDLIDELLVLIPDEPEEDILVNNPPVIISIVITPINPETDDILTAVANVSDIDGDSIYLSYQWNNGEAIVGEDSDTLDLSILGNGDEGDVITVTVTANDSSGGIDVKTSEGVTVSDLIIEDPVIEDPIIEDLVIEDSVIEDPVIEDPVIEDPVIEDPVINDSVNDEPVLNESVNDELVIIPTDL